MLSLSSIREVELVVRHRNGDVAHILLDPLSTSVSLDSTTPPSYTYGGGVAALSPPPIKRVTIEGIIIAQDSDRRKEQIVANILSRLLE